MNDYKCSCAPGFYGQVCQIDIDDCLPDPCNERGVCVDQANSYLCECFSEYTVRQ